MNKTRDSNTHKKFLEVQIKQSVLNYFNHKVFLKRINNAITKTKVTGRNTSIELSMPSLFSLSVCLSVCLFVCLSVCMSVCEHDNSKNIQLIALQS